MKFQIKYNLKYIYLYYINIFIEYLDFLIQYNIYKYTCLYIKKIYSLFNIYTHTLEVYINYFIFVLNNNIQ
jgi:hypothetical protein